MDAIALPIAVLVLWYVVRSCRLLLVPLAATCTAAATSFGIMYFVGLGFPVEITTPSLMMSILIAMSVDYSLFILTRFREELLRLRSSDLDQVAQVHEAVVVTMQTAGTTVLLSGVVFTASFVVLAFFPLAFISSLGVGCAVALGLTIVVNLTLAPCILGAFPCFFARCVAPEAHQTRRWASNLRHQVFRTSSSGDSKAERQLSLSYSSLSTGDSCRPIASAGAASCEETAVAEARMRGYRPFWVWLGRTNTTFPGNLVFLSLVLILISNMGCATFSMKITDNMLQSIPRGTNSYESFRRLTEVFGAGNIEPYKVMLEARADDNSILTAGFWNTSQQILKEMADQLAPEVSGADFQFMSYNNGSDIPWKDIHLCLQAPELPKENWLQRQVAKVLHHRQYVQYLGEELQYSEYCPEILYWLDFFTDARRQQNATFGHIRTKFDPTGNKGSAFLKKLRSLAEDMSRQHGVPITVVGNAANNLDIIEKIYAIFPMTIVITLLIVLLAVGVVFKSAFIPLRSVLSICLTLCWVYGLAVSTYQWGALDWTGLAGLSGQFKAQPWCIPIISFFIVVGICLDYDMFLLTRATEFRSMGMEAQQAMLHALCSTGGIITAAGVIMSIAFGGLLFSTMLNVNALAFFMVFAVLCDTFLVRCLFAPAIMSYAGRFNWWPGPLYKDRNVALSASLLSCSEARADSC
eukprot:gnl/TRDRNA2_/TRDRNA2_134234_c0_seq1.p1 gnl/TRDRNA2_/TRDRNA2_134234_c0~~gnl/TRDRNA2_/TRDRNA2_134234_c0_seq1.p1  ORF type:complete len:810 (+),score=72.90 gnl/TRDRNA2_/TRDRNA2_134234_c0_seq1:350-2431(+)